LSDCKTCEHPQRKEIERQSKAGVPATMISVWTKEVEGGYVSRLALGKHLREHVGIVSRAGRRPDAGRLLEEIVAQGEEGLEDGTLRVTLKDAIAAQKALDTRAARLMGEEWQLKLVLALTGHAARVRVIDPELEAFEAEFRPLLESGVS
jgi:hypothetical protein